MNPDRIYTINGVKVSAKIIPDGTVWKDDSKAKAAGFRKGDLYKKQKKLTNGTGKVLSVTVHNTKGHAGIDDEGELYTRATYNENMGSARVHFYVDKNGAWQNLKAGTGMVPDDPEGSAEVAWHAGDGSTQDGGNMTSLSLEIIMGENDESINSAAYDNGARLIAWLLNKHGLTVDDVVSHTYWVNKTKGKIFADKDDQSTNIIYGQKWCPVYIFDSNTKSVAKKNWLEFKALISKYLEDEPEEPEEPEEPDEPEEDQDEEYKLGDVVYFKGGTHYTNANAQNGLPAKAGNAKITLIAPNGKHPYHLIHTDKESDVYGFVDKDTVSRAREEKVLAVGDAVMLKDGVDTFVSGARVSYWVKSTVLYVRALEKNNVALVSTEKTKNTYTGRFYVTDLKKI